MTLQTHPQTREMVFELEHFFSVAHFQNHTVSGLFFHGAISPQTGPTGSSAVDFPRTFVVLTVKDPEISRKFEKV